MAPKWHDQVRPLRTSWGRLSPAKPQQWDEELMWSGTRDPSALLSIHKAINFAGQFDWKWLDARNHSLAKYARQKLLEIPGVTAISPDSREFYGWMVSVRLPSGDHSGLQQKLWKKYSIEVPIFQFEGDYLARVSCPLYISRPDVDFFVDSLHRELGRQ
ncbi:MAG TPA: hypothetical protein DDW52_00085 [Planctomycetaceae bacterium]|nr:hypothetical protein [Planctomycetaceae bacterium]